MSRKNLDVLLSLLIVLLLAWAIWAASDWPFRTRLFPQMIGFPVLGIALLQLASSIWRALRTQPELPLAESTAALSGYPAVQEPAGSRMTMYGSALGASASDGLQPLAYSNLDRKRAIAISAWTIGFALGLWLLGFKLGSPLLTFAFLKYGARETWKTSAVISVATYLFFLLVFELALSVPFSPGLIAQSLGLQSFDWYLVNPLMQALRGQ